jgi:PST family polysaccharide transporter
VPQAVLALSHFAFRLLDGALGVVWQCAGRLAMPRLCALQHDRQAMAETYGDVAQLQALLGLPICAGVALVAPDMVAVLLGPAWAGTGEATRAVGLAAMAVVLHGDQGSLFVAVGKARWNLRVAVAHLAIPLAALALVRPDTPLEAALVWAAQCVLVPPVLAFVVLRELRRPLSWLARKVAPAVAATAAMALAVLAVQNALALPQPTRLLAGVAAGATVYAAVAWVALGRRLPPALLTTAPATAGPRPVPAPPPRPVPTPTEPLAKTG